MEGNPLDDIENKRANLDMGIMAAQIYEGALHESGDVFKAYLITSAYFSGMFHPNQKLEDDDT